jgi:hypothetical protein
MLYFRKPRKNLRTNIKKTNMKKLKIDKVVLKEYLSTVEEVQQHVA